MPFYTIRMSAYIDLFCAAGVEIQMDSWIGLTLDPRYGGLWFLKLTLGYMSLKPDMITDY